MVLGDFHSSSPSSQSALHAWAGGFPAFPPDFFHLYPLSSSSPPSSVLDGQEMWVEKRKSWRHLFLSLSLCEDTSEHAQSVQNINYKKEICRPAALLGFCISVGVPKKAPITYY